MIDLNCTERVFIGRLEISIPGRTSSSLVTSCEGSRLHHWGDKFPIRRRFMIADMGLHGTLLCLIPVIVDNWTDLFRDLEIQISKYNVTCEIETFLSPFPCGIMKGRDKEKILWIFHTYWCLATFDSLWDPSGWELWNLLIIVRIMRSQQNCWRSLTGKY